MSRLGERFGVLEALAFSTALTAGIAVVILVLARHSLAGFEHAVHQPWWILLGGVMGLIIVFTVTYAGPRIGVAATVGILIAGQLAMGGATRGSRRGRRTRSASSSPSARAGTSSSIRWRASSSASVRRSCRSSMRA